MTWPEKVYTTMLTSNKLLKRPRDRKVEGESRSCFIEYYLPTEDDEKVSVSETFFKQLNDSDCHVRQ